MSLWRTQNFIIQSNLDRIYNKTDFLKDDYQKEFIRKCGNYFI